jgi:Ca-activated chloride channel family protein
MMVELPMSFIWPAMLFSLLLMPPIVGLYLRMQRRRRQLALSYGGGGPGQGKDRRRHIPAAMLMVVLALLLFALARPQMVVTLPRMQGTVILAFDVSGSMAANDLKPTRLEAAKVAALAFLQHQPASVLIGVVAFSDNGFTVQVPTNDQETIITTINRLAPESGTSVGSGILASLSLLASLDTEPAPRLYTNVTPMPTPTPTPVPAGTVTGAAIVLLTDGENNESPDPLDAAQAAADRGVRIYTVGIGSAAGTTLEVEGFSVHTQLDAEMLQQVSQLTGGAYYSAENAQDLRTIYEKLNPQLVIKAEKMEVTAILAGVSIVVLLIGAALSLLWFGRMP